MGVKTGVGNRRVVRAGRQWPLQARCMTSWLVLTALHLPLAYADPPAQRSTVHVALPHEQTAPPQTRALPAPHAFSMSHQLEAARGPLPQAFIENNGQVDERAKL